MRAYLCRKSERLRTFFGRGKAALLSTSIAIVLRSSAFSSVSMASDSRPAVFVVGNEAADVDSLVAAYTMAQLLESSEVQAIALAQIPREEFRLRGDAVALFREAGSRTLEDGSPVSMRFWNEVDWGEVKKLESRSLVLVDHNKMTDQMAALFEGRVTQVLDHHAGGVSYPKAQSIIDESLGSCCSLVVEQFMQTKGSNLTKELGTLMAGAILLDCRNFDPAAKKGTSRDQAALRHLESVDVPSKDPTRWYKELMDARKDVSHLTVRDLMLLDTKVVTLRGMNVAVASIFGTITEVCARAGTSAHVAEIAKTLAAERGYSAIILLFSKDKLMGKRRALAFVPLDSPSSELCEDIAKQMSETPGNLPQDLRENPLYQTQGLVETGFELQPIKELEPLNVYSLKGDVSRKTVLPFATMAALAAAERSAQPF